MGYEIQSKQIHFEDIDRLINVDFLFVHLIHQNLEYDILCSF